MYPTNPTNSKPLAFPLLQELVKPSRCSKTPYSPQLEDPSKKKSSNFQQRYSSSKSDSNVLIGNFYGFFEFVETAYQSYAAQIYMIALSLVIWILFKMKETLLHDLKDLETLGFGLIPAFLLHLFLTKNLKKKLLNEKKANFHFVKDSIILLSGSIIFFIYGLRILPLNMALSICCSAFVIVILLETMISEKEFSVSHVLLAICAYIGVVLVFLDSKEESIRITNFWLLYGITIVGIAAMFLTGFFIKLSKVTESSLLSFKGSLALISFVAMITDKDFKWWPTLNQTLMLVIFGALIYVGFILLARSLQLTGAGEISPYLFFYTTMSPLFGWLFGKSGFKIETAGSLITQGSLITLLLITPKMKRTVDTTTSENIYQLDSTFVIELTERSLNTTYN